MWEDVGSRHPFPPEPIIAEDTQYVDAGSVKIGLERRRLDGINNRIQATYEGGPFGEIFRVWREERTARKLKAGQQKGAKPPTSHAAAAGSMGPTGASIHVVGRDNGHEYLRFDCFDDVPHYHYLHPWATPEECVNHVVEWDDVAHGPLMPWALETLRTRLPDMLTEAGGGELAARLDPTELDRAVDELKKLVNEEFATSAS